MKKDIWNGFDRIEFEFQDREAILVFPKEENKTDKWLFKTEYFGAFPDMEVEMLKKGWHLAFIANKTRWCHEEDLDIKKDFADFLSKEYGLSEKCVPVGMSCGGMIAVKFAAKYPKYISCLYLDAPVMNLLSCPCGIGEAGDTLHSEFVKATGMTIADLINYREHPVDKISQLLAADIPVVMVYGDSDTVVPYKENGIVLEKYYKSNHGKILTIGKSGCGHHPHGLDNPAPIIEFILNCLKEK